MNDQTFRTQKKQERASRDQGRAAVQASKEIPALVEKIKSYIAAGKDKEQDTFFKTTEYQIAINQLNNALFKTGMSAQEVDDYISEVIGQRYSWRYGKAKHGFDSRDDFYAAVDTYKKEHAVEHYGVLGMKWGIRRYQNPDGTLTALGKKHMDDGKTQEAIDKWNQKKGNAIAKGNKKFVEKHLDYLSNDDINKFNERLRARNTIAGLKKEAESINSERFKTWLNTASNVVQNAGNLAENGIKLYNSVVKINNAFSSKKLKPINTNLENDKKPETIFETWENGKLTRKQRQYTDEDGNKRDVTKTYNDKKNPESHENIYDKDGKLTKTVRNYTDDAGNSVRDVHNYVDVQKKGENKSSDNSSSNNSGSAWQDAWNKYAADQEKVLAKAEEAANYRADQKKKKGGKG